MARARHISSFAILRLLHHDQLVRLTPRDAVCAEELVRTREDWPLDLLALSLASLLATDRQSWRDIHGRIVRLAEEAELGPADVDQDVLDAGASAPGTGASESDEAARRSKRRPRPTWRQRLAGVSTRVWLSAAVGAVLLPLLVLGGLAILQPEEKVPRVEPPKQATPEAAQAPEVTQTVTFEQVAAETVVRSTVDAGLAWDPPLLWLMLAFSLALGAAGLRWLRLPNEARALRQQQERDSLAERERLAREDRGLGEPYHIERAPPFAQAAMDDAAAILGRVGEHVDSPDLDLDATIDRTARRAGRLTPVFEPGRRPAPLLIFVDVEKRDHPFLDGVEQVLARWERTGLRFERYDYEHRPLHLRPAGAPIGAAHIPLSSLARRRAGAPLLIFSRLVAPAHLDDHEDRPDRLDWLRRLGAWPARVLVDLDPRPDHERPGFHQTVLALIHKRGLRRYPFDPAGLLAAARALAGDPGPAPAPRTLRPLSEIEQAVRTWAACASYVPDPTWAHVDAIRRALPELVEAMPHSGYLQRLLEWIVRDDPSAVPESDGGQRIHIEPVRRGRIIEDERIRDPNVEWRGRGLLIDQLLAAAPDSKMERLQRDLKLAMHRAVLDPGQAHLLLRFADTAMAPEARRLAGEELGRQQREAVLRPWRGALRDTLASFAAGEEGEPRVPVGQFVRARWQRPDLVRAAVAAVVVAVAWLVAGATVAEPEVERDYLPPVWNAVIDDFGELDDPPTGRALGITHVAEIDGAQPMRFVGLSGGEFTMGTSEREPGRFDDEGPRHRVRLSGFEIAEHEITQGQWRAVMGDNPSDCDVGCGDDLPVQNVSWADVVRFMNTLTAKTNQARAEGEKLTLCYEIVDDRSVIWRPGCTGYRLPTEAEWEYAVRAGTSTAYSFGDDAGQLGEYAWYEANASRQVQPVGRKKPNPWGLRDMHGNVWEWGWDEYGSYQAGSRSDPRGPASAAEPDTARTDPDSPVRVLRGGSFEHQARDLRSGYRLRYWPGRRVWNQGARCARAAPPALSP
ncbi:SUMF1/EgtB/PvdO family nonheme iron enzyme [Haliangium sp.]|uniref:formylglycine-generating enzyme family protein n=1 Tax=Haliangium sp. TaxID=2663208 RepID=UPI003D0BECF9